MRNRFDEQLEQLNVLLIEMGSRCEQAISSVAIALTDGDLEMAKDVIACDEEIDQMEKQIESLCLKLILHQQPVAKDLRLISAALKMITDMERIGDQAADIAEIAMIANIPQEAGKVHLADMAAATKTMITESIDSFVKSDLTLARKVMEDDDVVDGLFDKVKEEVTHLISNHPEKGEYAIDLLMVAKYFERIGDHAENIAEWVDFSITGVHKGELVK